MSCGAVPCHPVSDRHLCPAVDLGFVEVLTEVSLYFFDRTDQGRPLELPAPVLRADIHQGAKFSSSGIVVGDSEGVQLRH